MNVAAGAWLRLWSRPGSAAAARCGVRGIRRVIMAAMVALRDNTAGNERQRGDGRFDSARARAAALKLAEQRREQKALAESVTDQGVGLPNHSEILEAIRIGLPQLCAIVSDPASKPSEIMDAMRLLGQWAGLTRQSERNVDASPESRLAAAYRARGVEVPEHLRPYDKP